MGADLLGADLTGADLTGADLTAADLTGAADTSIDTSVDTGTPTDYVAASGGTMILLSAGSFSMGSGLGDPDSAYVDHVVTLSHDFWLAQTETTRGEWESDPANTGWTYSSVTYGYPCTGTTADCPAETMTWSEAAMYANWLSVEDGLTECYLADGTDLAAAYIADPYACPGYRLPTEAEWEYAARAGADTTYAGSNTAAAVAWTYETAGTSVHEACSLAANGWGLCDMSGNICEWTNDWYVVDYGGYASGVATIDPPGPAAGSSRVIRGGTYGQYASWARVANRDLNAQSCAYGSYGFRLARSIP